MKTKGFKELPKGSYTEILEQDNFQLTHQEKLILTFLNEGRTVKDASDAFEVGKDSISKMIQRLKRKNATYQS